MKAPAPLRRSYVAERPEAEDGAPRNSWKCTERLAKHFTRVTLSREDFPLPFSSVTRNDGAHTSVGSMAGLHVSPYLRLTCIQIYFGSLKVVLDLNTSGPLSEQPSSPIMPHPPRLALPGNAPHCVRRKGGRLVFNKPICWLRTAGRLRNAMIFALSRPGKEERHCFDRSRCSLQQGPARWLNPRSQ